MNLEHLTPCHLLCDERPLLIDGEDARIFLNRLLTINVLKINEGEGYPAHLLDATGKLSASLYLICLSATRWLAIPRTLSAEALLERLDMYLFGEAVTFTRASLVGLRVIGSPEALLELADPLEYTSPVLSPVMGEALGWRLLSERARGALTLQADRWARGSGLVELEWWGEVHARAELSEGLTQRGVSALSVEGAEQLRLSLGAPDRPEYQARYTPLDVEGSSPLLSVSEGKGCYPGQEVIERTLALGKPARTLVHLSFAHAEVLERTRPSKLGVDPLDLPIFCDPERTEEAGLVSSISPVGSTPRYALASLKRRYAGHETLYLQGGVTLHVTSRQSAREGGDE